MYFSAAPSSENDHGSMNLDSALDILQRLAGIALEPVPIEGLGCEPELDDEVSGQVLGLDLAALFPPKVAEGAFVFTHNDPSIRTADERASILAHHVFPEVPEAIL